jgi:hypothetical protein
MENIVNNIGYRMGGGSTVNAGGVMSAKRIMGKRADHMVKKVAALPSCSECGMFPIVGGGCGVVHCPYADHRVDHDSGWMR